MFELTRQEAADKLNVSTRSIDRYIRSWKIRSEKQWKVVYVNSEDINNILWWSSVKQEVIMPKQDNPVEPQVNTTQVSTKQDNIALENIYNDLRWEIKKKDETIQDLSIQLWRAQEIAKNSVSLIDFKKSQFLLEESKWHLSSELDRLEKEKSSLANDLKYQKNSNMILIVFVILLIVISWIIFFINV